MTARTSSWRRAGLHAFLAIAALVIGAGLVFYVAMSLLFDSSPWSNEPGRALAARLQAAGSPLIREVVFQPRSMIDPPEVHVIVWPGVTEAQAERLWCDVVAPAGGSQFEGDLGALIYDDAGNRLASLVTCESPLPS
jgi:hypothetical protein